MRSTPNILTLVTVIRMLFHKTENYNMKSIFVSLLHELSYIHVFIPLSEGFFGREFLLKNFASIFKNKVFVMYNLFVLATKL